MSAPRATELHAAALAGGAPPRPRPGLRHRHGGRRDRRGRDEFERHSSSSTGTRPPPRTESRYLYSLTVFPDPALAARAYELARTEVRTQNAPFVVQLLLAHRDHGPATWARVDEGLGRLGARIPRHTSSPGCSTVSRMLCRDRALADDVRSFIAAHPLPSGQRTIDQTVERLGVNQAFVTRLAGAGPPFWRSPWLVRPG